MVKIPDNTFHPLIEPFINDLIKATTNINGEYELDIEEFAKDRIRFINNNNLNDLPISYMNGVYIAPIFSEEVCNSLLHIIDNQANTFEPNLEEPLAAQIPEIVLSERYPELFQAFGEAAKLSILPLFLLTTGDTPSVFNSIQLARYMPENTAYGCWHTDQDSLFTCVISLGPERHEGGGTAFMPNGILQQIIEIPPLPKGWGVFFCGRMMNHKGLPVTKGVRDLLVYWMD